MCSFIVFMPSVTIYNVNSHENKGKKTAFSCVCSAFSTCCTCVVTPVNEPVFCLLFCHVFSFPVTCTNSEPGRSALLRPGTVQF